VGGLVEPRALGVGYDTIRDLLGGNLVGSIVIGLVIAKALMWAIALGSGTSGGVLAPLLIMGGALGAVEAHWIPLGDAGLWAMISMAAMMGGTMRAPLTAIAFLVELTRDVAVLPGLLIACVAAHAVTVLLMRRSILTEKVARRGYHVMREYSVSPLAQFRVEDAMERDVPTVPADMRIDTIFLRLAQNDSVMGRRQAWPVVNADGSLAGILTRGDVLAVLEREDDAEPTALEAGSSAPVVTYPDELLERALDTMLQRGVGRLPVVDRQEPTRLLGILTRQGIAGAYQQVLEEESLREPGGLAQRFGLGRRHLESAGK
jgi:CBS domain-containing protein